MVTARLGFRCPVWAVHLVGNLQRRTLWDSHTAASSQSASTASAQGTRWTRRWTGPTRRSCRPCARATSTPGSPSTWTPSPRGPSTMSTSRTSSKGWASSPPIRSSIPTPVPAPLSTPGPRTPQPSNGPSSPPWPSSAASASRLGRGGTSEPGAISSARRRSVSGGGLRKTVDGVSAHGFFFSLSSHTPPHPLPLSSCPPRRPISQALPLKRVIPMPLRSSSNKIVACELSLPSRAGAL